MKPGRYDFRVEIFADIAVISSRATHLHSDSLTALGAAFGKAASRSASHHIVLDMTGVVLFSSSALRALRTAHLAAVNQGGRVVASGGGEMAISVLKFASFIKHYQTVRDALTDLSAKAAIAYAQQEGHA